MYELKTEQFSGPIEKLLELIEEKKMDITTVSLAAVTADFLNYVKTLKDTESTQTDAEIDMEDFSIGQRQVGVHPRLLADFLVVSSRLLLIKSKALLPSLVLTPEEQQDISDLQDRLKLYQQLKPAIAAVKKQWEAKHVSAVRPLFFGRQAVFAPAKNVNVKEVHDSLSRLLTLFEEVVPEETESIKATLLSLEETVKEVLNRLGALTSEGVLSFGHVTNKRPRQDVIILFLAVLHLLNDQRIRAEQEDGFGEISISKRAG